MPAAFTEAPYGKDNSSYPEVATKLLLPTFWKLAPANLTRFSKSPNNCSTASASEIPPSLAEVGQAFANIGQIGLKRRGEGGARSRGHSPKEPKLVISHVPEGMQNGGGLDLHKSNT